MLSDTLSILEVPATVEPKIDAPTNPVDQAKQVFRKGNRFAALFGFVLGGFVPIASYTLIHQEATDRPLLWILIAGGLIYSAISVYTWAKLAFKYTLKALGFVVLLEGIMTFSQTAWLALSGLAILIVLNGISAALTLQKPEDPKLELILESPPCESLAKPDRSSAAARAWVTRREREKANGSS